MTDKKELRLIAFDLDGTFLNDSKEIPEENLQALEKAAERGIAVVPATGRLYPALPHELRELPFMRYYILINGAKVYDAREDKVLFSAELPNELALALFSHAEEIGCLYDCYLRDKGLMSRGLYDALDEIVENKIYLEYMKSIRKPVENLKELIREDGGFLFVLREEEHPPRVFTGACRIGEDGRLRCLTGRTGWAGMPFEGEFSWELTDSGTLILSSDEAGDPILGARDAVFTPGDFAVYGALREGVD